MGTPEESLCMPLSILRFLSVCCLLSAFQSILMFLYEERVGKTVSELSPSSRGVNPVSFYIR